MRWEGNELRVAAMVATTWLMSEQGASAARRAAGIHPTFESTTGDMGPGLGGCSELPGGWRRHIVVGSPTGEHSRGLACHGALALLLQTMGVGERRSWWNQQRGKVLLTRPLLSNGLPEKEKEESQQRDGAVRLSAK